MTLGWWDRLAGALQVANRITEADKDDRYTDAEVRRSVVYTREDLTMAVALLSTLNRQLHTLLGFVAVLNGLVVILICRAFGWL